MRHTQLLMSAAGTVTVTVTVVVVTVTDDGQSTCGPRAAPGRTDPLVVHLTVRCCDFESGVGVRGFLLLDLGKQVLGRSGHQADTVVANDYAA